ncbi:MAG: argininosuccinate synthase domain-containing protein [Actinomycetota bacterium]
MAQAEGATAVAHRATGKGNDGVRFSAPWSPMTPGMRILAPAADWELTSSGDEVCYAERHGIEIPTGTESPYSRDGSIWGTSTECGPLEDPAVVPPGDARQITGSSKRPRRRPRT